MENDRHTEDGMGFAGLAETFEEAETRRIAVKDRFFTEYQNAKHSFPRLESIEAALVEMLPGFCGVKFGALVWRISETAWAVGQSSVNKNERFDLASAAKLIHGYQ